MAGVYNNNKKNTQKIKKLRKDLKKTETESECNYENTDASLHGLRTCLMTVAQKGIASPILRNNLELQDKF